MKENFRRVFPDALSKIGNSAPSQFSLMKSQCPIALSSMNSAKLQHSTNSLRWERRFTTECPQFPASWCKVQVPRLSNNARRWAEMFVVRFKATLMRKKSKVSALASMANTLPCGTLEDASRENAPMWAPTPMTIWSLAGLYSGTPARSVFRSKLSLITASSAVPLLNATSKGPHDQKKKDKKKKKK